MKFALVGRVQKQSKKAKQSREMQNKAKRNKAEKQKCRRRQRSTRMPPTGITRVSPQATELGRYHFCGLIACKARLCAPKASKRQNGRGKSAMSNAMQASEAKQRADGDITSGRDAYKAPMF